MFTKRKQRQAELKKKWKELEKTIRLREAKKIDELTESYEKSPYLTIRDFLLQRLAAAGTYINRDEFFGILDLLIKLEEAFNKS